MARFTASGAAAGAAALPKRSFARVPGTVGPELGKVFALAEDAIAIKAAAEIRILGLRESTGDFERVLCHKIGVCKEKKLGISNFNPTPDVLSYD